MRSVPTPDGGPAVIEGFEHLPSMLFVVEGADLLVTAANGAVRELAGDDLVGRPLPQAFPLVEAEGAFALLTQVLTTGEPLERRELRFQADDGGTPVEVWFDFLMAPVPGPDGLPKGVVCDVRDATPRVLARMAAEQRARQVEERYAQALDLVHALQDAMLPKGVPLLPGVDVAARYLLAEKDTDVGGDWFDAVTLSAERVALVVGDVVGHGMEASAAMGRLRAALRSALTEHHDPADALRVLDRYAENDDEAFAATVVVAVLERRGDGGTLSYCTAGHPPPLVVPADGRARFLPATGAGPLGSASVFASRQLPLAAGDLVLLYSDGIVDRPGLPPGRGQGELLDVVTEVKRGRAWQAGGSLTDVENVCTTSLERLVGETGHDDDATLVAAELRAERPVTYAVVEPADIETPGRVRASLKQWLDGLGVDPLDQFALQHAVGELVTNSVDHAYATPGHGVVEVGGSLTGDGRIALSVRDYGAWAGVELADGPPDNPPDRGRGLAMARSLVDAFSVERGPSGTIGFVRHRVERPVTLLRSRVGSQPQERTPHQLAVVPAGPGRVDVLGDVDVSSAEWLRSELLRAGRGGVEALDVELDEVTFLGSAGVRVLVELVRSSPQTRLHAASGTVAHQVLKVARLVDTDDEDDLLDPPQE